MGMRLLGRRFQRCRGEMISEAWRSVLSSAGGGCRLFFLWSSNDRWISEDRQCDFRGFHSWASFVRGMRFDLNGRGRRESVVERAGGADGFRELILNETR